MSEILETRKFILGLKSLWMSMKRMGLLYILPVLVAIGLTSSISIWLAASEGWSVKLLVCLLCACGFLLMFIFPVLLFYFKFFGRINLGVSIGKKKNIYIVSNNLHSNSLQSFGLDFYKHIINYISLVNSALQECKYYTESTNTIINSLNGIIVVFVSDISEKDYYSRWGIKYTHISGLKCNGYVLVEKSILSTFEETALSHELSHVVVEGMYDKLCTAGKYTCVKNRLGLE